MRRKSTLPPIHVLDKTLHLHHVAAAAGTVFRTGTADHQTLATTEHHTTLEAGKFLVIGNLVVADDPHMVRKRHLGESLVAFLKGALLRQVENHEPDATPVRAGALQRPLERWKRIPAHPQLTVEADIGRESSQEPRRSAERLPGAGHQAGAGPDRADAVVFFRHPPTGNIFRNV